MEESKEPKKLIFQLYDCANYLEGHIVFPISRKLFPFEHEISEFLLSNIIPHQIKERKAPRYLQYLIINKPSFQEVPRCFR